MKPVWRITCNDSDITDKLKDRLLNLNVKDEAGMKSDTLDLQLDDRDYECPIPPAKGILKVWLGWGSPEYMGTYVIDEIGLKGNAKTMTIRAKASETAPGYKSPHTHSFDETNVKEIVETIAARHGLTPLVDSKFAGDLITHIDQVEESDAHFLSRLAKEYSAIAKPANDKLLFHEKDSEATPSGSGKPVIKVLATETKDWKATLTDRSDYKEVQAKWMNHETGLEEWLVVANDSTTGQSYKEKKLFPTRAEAKEAASSKLKQMTQGKLSVDFTLATGDPTIFAEGQVSFSGFRSPINGKQLPIRSVSHKLDASGYTTAVNCSEKAPAVSEKESSDGGH
jgi:hypothetical protein